MTTDEAQNNNENADQAFSDTEAVHARNFISRSSPLWQSGKIFVDSQALGTGIPKDIEESARAIEEVLDLDEIGAERSSVAYEERLMAPIDSLVDAIGRQLEILDQLRGDRIKAIAERYSSIQNLLKSEDERINIVLRMQVAHQWIRSTRNGRFARLAGSVFWTIVGAWAAIWYVAGYSTELPIAANAVVTGPVLAASLICLVTSYVITKRRYLLISAHENLLNIKDAFIINNKPPKSLSDKPVTKTSVKSKGDAAKHRFFVTAIGALCAAFVGFAAQLASMSKTRVSWSPTTLALGGCRHATGHVVLASSDFVMVAMDDARTIAIPTSSIVAIGDEPINCASETMEVIAGFGSAVAQGAMAAENRWRSFVGTTEIMAARLVCIQSKNRTGSGVAVSIRYSKSRINAKDCTVISQSE